MRYSCEEGYDSAEGCAVSKEDKGRMGRIGLIEVIVGEEGEAVLVTCMLR